MDDDPKAPLSGGLEIAPGLGLRYLTAFGPIRFDIAWVVNPKEIMTRAVGDDPAHPAVAPTPVSAYCNDRGKTCIHEVRWAFHVTLGEAF